MPRFALQPGEYLSGMTRSQAETYVRSLGLTGEEHNRMMKLAARKPEKQQVARTNENKMDGRLEVLIDYARKSNRFTTKEAAKEIGWNYDTVAHVVREAVRQELLLRQPTQIHGRRGWEYIPAESRSE